MAGIFITFEGPDGCGKSTQARLFAQWLSEQGLKTILTREPGGTPMAEKIRRVILEPSDEEVDPVAEILLYAASRTQHVAGLIRPALEEGEIVVCERFTDSTIAYQGYGLGYDLELIAEVNRIATQGLSPHWTVLLDVDTIVAAERMGRRTGEKDRIEARGMSFQNRVRQGYLDVAQQSRERIEVFPAGEAGVNVIQDQIREAFSRRFPG